MEIKKEEISCSWKEIFANPLFRRAILPNNRSGLRTSPLPKALVTIVLAICLNLIISNFIASRFIEQLFIFFNLALMHNLQTFLTKLEVHSLATKGHLVELLNSGLSKEELFMGLIFPFDKVKSLTVMLLFMIMYYDESYSSYWLFALAIFLLMLIEIIIRPKLNLETAALILEKQGLLMSLIVSFATLVIITISMSISAFTGVILSIIVSSAGLPIPGTAVGWLSLIPGTVFFLILMFTWFIWRNRGYKRKFGSIQNLFDAYLERHE